MRALQVYHFLNLADKEDTVTNRLSSLALDHELGILALDLEEEINIADHGGVFDIVNSKLQASGRVLQTGRMMNVSSVKKMRWL
jgi:hypothetical protein